MKEIKSRKKMIPIENGMTIMDNGFCLQIISIKGAPPIISKEEFQKFKSIKGVREVKNHGYDDTISLWKYK